MLNLYDYQLDAVRKMKNGCILCGDVGSGKSVTALAYYYILNGGSWKVLTGEEPFQLLLNKKPLYIITTARKRDTFEWEDEMCKFLLYSEGSTIDSWNNIKKYVDVTDSFFIFDEQRVVGSGAWVKSFLKITKSNQWVLLSATPGDTWSDYIPVFIANGFYKNRSEFVREHIVYNHFTKYPKVDRYLGTGKLLKLKRQILVEMDYKKTTKIHHEDIWCNYSTDIYKKAGKDRWDPFKDEPITNAGELCMVWRKIVNCSYERQTALMDLVEENRRCIIFYNFDYELEIFHNLFDSIKGLEVTEWNGHKHEPLPTGNCWVYLVQYTAGAEGWNCTQTNVIIFYSQNYSYKLTKQAAGRIDRLNTPYTDLYFYHLKSKSGIDLAINRALKAKKNFNEKKFVEALK